MTDFSVSIAVIALGIGVHIGVWASWIVVQRYKRKANYWMNQAVESQGALQTAKREPPRHSLTEPCPPPKPKPPTTIEEYMRWYRDGHAWITEQTKHDIAHHVTWGTVDELMPRVEDEPT